MIQSRKLELVRADLAGPDLTSIQRLPVERVVACSLQVRDADVRYAQTKGSYLEGRRLLNPETVGPNTNRR
jgi:hypothetical protein